MTGTLHGNVVLFWEIRMGLHSRKCVAVNTIFVSLHELSMQNNTEKIRKMTESKQCKSRSYDQLFVMNSKMEEELQVGGSGKMNKDGAIILFAIKSDSLIGAAEEPVEIDEESQHLVANELLFEDDDFWTSGP